MRRKFIHAAAAVSAVALALTACGGESNTNDGDTGGETVTLQMVESLTSPARTELLKSMLKDFETENPDIKVDLISPPTAIRLRGRRPRSARPDRWSVHQQQLAI